MPSPRPYWVNSLPTISPLTPSPDELPDPQAAATEATSRWPSVLIVIATFVTVLTVTTTWVHSQLLDTDEWVELSGQLLDKPEIRSAVVSGSAGRSLADIVADVSTALLRQIAWAAIIYGAIVLLVAILLGSGRAGPATQSTRTSPSPITGPRFVQTDRKRPDQSICSTFRDIYRSIVLATARPPAAALDPRPLFIQSPRAPPLPVER